MLNIGDVDGGIKVDIRVQPRSSRNQVTGEQGGALKIKLTAPPVDGEANKALIDFIAQWLKIPKKNVLLVKGETSRHKTLEIRGISREEFLKKMG